MLIYIIININRYPVSYCDKVLLSYGIAHVDVSSARHNQDVVYYHNVLE